MPISPIAHRNAAITAQAINTKASTEKQVTSEPSTAVSGQYDILELSPTDEQSRLGRFEQILQSLKEQYPHLTFTFTKDLSADEFSARAAQAGRGDHILISESFLNRLQQSDKDFFTCQQMLGKVCQQLSNNDSNMAQGVYLGEKAAVSWSVPSEQNDLLSSLQQPKEQTLLDKIKSLQTTSDTQKLETYLSASSRKSTNTGGQYMRVANAKSKASVQAAMSEAQRSIASLRLTASMGTDKERIEANRAIRSYQKLLLRGNQKLKRFDQEALLKARKKRAENQKEVRKARQLKEELSQKRLSRHVADGAIRCEGRLQDYAYRFAKRYDPYDEERERYEAAMSDTAPSSTSLDETGEISSSDIAISDVATF